MGKKGCQFVPTPARGIFERGDLDTECHHELSEEVNSYLIEFATERPQEKDKLYLAAVNPDGPRERPGERLAFEKERLCFWHPRSLAIALKQRLYAGDTDSPEDRHLTWHAKMKKFHIRLHNRIKGQEEIIKEVKRRAVGDEQTRFTWEKNEEAERQFARERKKMDEDC